MIEPLCCNMLLPKDFGCINKNFAPFQDGCITSNLPVNCFFENYSYNQQNYSRISTAKNVVNLRKKRTAGSSCSSSSSSKK